MLSGKDWWVSKSCSHSMSSIAKNCAHEIDRRIKITFFEMDKNQR